MINPLADINNLCFFDTETRALPGFPASDGNVKTAGTYRYAKHSFAIISTWSIAGEPAWDISLNSGFEGDWLCWDEMPGKLREFHKRVERGEAWYCAWNAGFDRNIWNWGTYDFPALEPENVIDAMAQAVASGLPPDLEGSAMTLTGEGKQPDGKKLIQQFCTADGDTPQSHPLDWERFKSYGRRDVDKLVDVFVRTRPLAYPEWEDYWVSERINERGIAIDTQFARRCAKISVLDHVRINAKIKQLTEGHINTVNQHAAIADWAFDIGDAVVRKIMGKVWDEEVEPDENGVSDLVATKIGVDRRRIERIVAYMDTKASLTPEEQAMMKVLVLRQYGGSASPKKFQKMFDQHDGGRLRGSYVFNGANQTGRFSSKGTQIHNLTRSTLGPKLEPVIINLINELDL
jgi:DNA polymerase